jgi:4-hydroxybenzoate polyprenyltransferase
MLELSFSNSLFVALILSTSIILYDAWLKHTQLGPIAMGLCRFLNIYLGLSGNPAALSPEASFHLASIIGLYIVGVTWFARTEEGRSEKRQLVLASIVIFAAIALGVTFPTHRPLGSTPFYFPYLIVAFGIWIAIKLVAAIQSPNPKEVQAAVKRCILGLIVLDAVLATIFGGGWGLLLILLLLPARWLGQWIYST